MSLVSLREKIKTELDTLAGTGQPLSEVHDYYKMDVESYPACLFEPSTIASDYATTCENDRMYAFRLMIIQEVAQAGHQKALDIICEVVDNVIDHFDGNYLLDGQTKSVKAVPADFSYVEKEDGLVLVAEVKIECLVPHNIYA